MGFQRNLAELMGEGKVLVVVMNRGVDCVVSHLWVVKVVCGGVIFIFL